MNAGALYDRALAESADLGPHVEVLASTVRDLNAQRVIELGVRDGHSTGALLYGLEATGGSLWSVDINPPPFTAIPRWTFVYGDDTDPAVVAQLPTEVDLVFIDTSHAWAHTLIELEEYVPRVRPGGLVLLHDTENEDPASHGAPIGLQPPFPVKRAIEDYCSEHGLPWKNDPRGWGLGTIYV